MIYFRILYHCADLSLIESDWTVATVFCTQAHLKTNVLLTEKSFPSLTVQTQVPTFRWKRRPPCVRSFKYQTRLCWVHLGRTCGHSGNYQRLPERYMSPLPRPSTQKSLSCFSTLYTQTTRAAEDHNRLKFWMLERARPGSAARKQSVLPYCCSTWRQALAAAGSAQKQEQQPNSLFTPLSSCHVLPPRGGSSHSSVSASSWIPVQTATRKRRNIARAGAKICKRTFRSDYLGRVLFFFCSLDSRASVAGTKRTSRGADPDICGAHTHTHTHTHTPVPWCTLLATDILHSDQRL